MRVPKLLALSFAMMSHVASCSTLPAAIHEVAVLEVRQAAEAAEIVGASKYPGDSVKGSFRN